MVGLWWAIRKSEEQCDGGWGFGEEGSGGLNFFGIFFDTGREARGGG